MRRKSRSVDFDSLKELLNGAQALGQVIAEGAVKLRGVVEEVQTAVDNVKGAMPSGVDNDDDDLPDDDESGDNVETQ